MCRDTAQAWLIHTPQFCLQRAVAIWPACLALVRRMFGDLVLDRLRGVQSLLRVEAACQRMQQVDVVSAKTVRRMLKKGPSAEQIVAGRIPRLAAAIETQVRTVT